MPIFQGFSPSLSIPSHMYYPNKYERKVKILADVPKKRTKSKDDEVLDFLRSTLLKAFDEGNESPYDLRENIVEELLKEIDTEAAGRQMKNMQEVKSVADIPNQQQITEHVIKGIPPVLLEWMMLDKNIWLCGGCIIRLLTKPTALKAWNGTDWDLFCSVSASKKLPCWMDAANMSRGESYGGLYNDKKIGATWYYQPKNLRRPVNIITGNFRNIGDVYDGFDFRFLQMGCFVDGGTMNFSVKSVESWVDLTQNVIRWSDKVSSSAKSGDKARKRIIKYINRGFRDGTGVVEKGILSKYGADLNQILDSFRKGK